MKQHLIHLQQMLMKSQTHIQAQQPLIKLQTIQVQQQHTQVKPTFHLQLHILLLEQVMNINQFN